MGPFHVAVAFWIFVAVAAVAGIVGDVVKRRQALEPLKLAIQRGQDLDPKVVEALLKRTEQDDDGDVDPAHLQMGGIITAASGVGVMAFSWFIAHVSADAFYPVLGAGVIAICVGAGLLIAARVLDERQQAKRAQAAQAGQSGHGA